MADTITLTIPSVVRLSIAGLGEHRDVDFSQADDPQAALQVIFDYGAQRWLNDRTGGSNQTNARRRAKADKRIEDLLRGRIRTGGGGGKRLDDMQRALRDVMESMFAKRLKPAAGRNKPKAAEVTKICRDPEFALRVFIALSRGERVDAESVTESFERNWPAVVQAAEEIVAQQKEGPNVDV